MFFSALEPCAHYSSFIIAAWTCLQPHWDGAGNGLGVWSCNNGSASFC